MYSYNEYLYLRDFQQAYYEMNSGTIDEKLLELARDIITKIEHNTIAFTFKNGKVISKDLSEKKIVKTKTNSTYIPMKKKAPFWKRIFGKNPS